MAERKGWRQFVSDERSCLHFEVRRTSCQQIVDALTCLIGFGVTKVEAIDSPPDCCDLVINSATNHTQVSVCIRQWCVNGVYPGVGTVSLGYDQPVFRFELIENKTVSLCPAGPRRGSKPVSHEDYHLALKGLFRLLNDRDQPHRIFLRYRQGDEEGFEYVEIGLYCDFARDGLANIDEPRGKRVCRQGSKKAEQEAFRRARREIDRQAEARDKEFCRERRARKRAKVAEMRVINKQGNN